MIALWRECDASHPPRNMSAAPEENERLAESHGEHPASELVEKDPFVKIKRVCVVNRCYVCFGVGQFLWEGKFGPTP